MWLTIRNLIGVSAVAALIWVFAEAESLRTADARPEIVFASEPDNDWIIELADPVEGRNDRITVSVDLEGSATAIDAAERALKKNPVLSPGMEGVPREPGQHTVVLREALRSHPDIRGRGVTIRRVEPSSVRVNIDELERRTVKISPSVPTDLLDGSPDVRPGTVEIRLPRSESRRLGDSSVALATVDPAQLATLTPAKRQTLPGIPISLPVEIAGSRYARMVPAMAEVSLTLRPQSRSVRLPSVPVHIRMAPRELGKWDIDIPEQDRFLSDVTITGPAEPIAKIESKATPVVATLSLSFEELERGIPSKEAAFLDLAPGLRAEAANKTVRLTIKKREAPLPKQ